MAKLEEPDKGHAWVIAFSACVINGILSGMGRMIGLLYVALIEEYGVSREQASLPFTVRNAVRYLAGPLAGILGQTFGVRVVTFIGGLIAAAGSLLCAFAPTVQTIVFFWGIIHGLGFALANTLFQVIINQYFERYRASASGIVLSGACLCSFIFPLAIEAVLDKYGLFGCFLLLAGLFLNVLPPALVLKSPPWVEFPEAYARQRALYYSHLNNDNLNKRHIPETSLSNTAESSRFKRTLTSVNSYNLCSRSQSCGPVFFKQVPKSIFKQKKSRHGMHSVVLTKYHSTDIITDLNCYEKNDGNQKGVSNPAFIRDGDVSSNSASTTSSTEPPERQLQQPCVKTTKNQSSLLRSTRDIPRLYLNPVYNLMSVSMATYFLLFLPVVATIVDYARDKGVPVGQEKLLIYALTIGDLIGRIGFGWITDRRCISLPFFMLMSFVSQGAFVAIFPLANSLAAWITVVGLYGVTAGIIFVHFPVLVHRYVDAKYQSIGIGCIGLFSSVCTFGIPPLIGYFRDHVGSYDGLFYIIAACSVINGLLWILVPVYEKVQESKQKQVDNIA